MLKNWLEYFFAKFYRGIFLALPLTLVGKIGLMLIFVPNPLSFWGLYPFVFWAVFIGLIAKDVFIYNFGERFPGVVARSAKVHVDVIHIAYLEGLQEKMSPHFWTMEWLVMELCPDPDLDELEKSLLEEVEKLKQKYWENQQAIDARLRR